MLRNSPEVPGDAVEELGDVQVDHTVERPAALPASAHRVQRRPPRPKAAGVGMEPRLRGAIQAPPLSARFLSATVSAPTVRVPPLCGFGISTARYRRRKVAARGAAAALLPLKKTRSTGRPPGEFTLAGGPGVRGARWRVDGGVWAVAGPRRRRWWCGRADRVPAAARGRDGRPWPSCQRGPLERSPSWGASAEQASRAKPTNRRPLK